MTLNNATNPIASFTAPAVTQNTDLQFELTVTDDTGQTGTDSVTITVQPTSGGGDTTPPVTTGTFTRTTSKGKVSYAITLAADEPATTHFRLTGQAHITAGGADSNRRPFGGRMSESVKGCKMPAPSRTPVRFCSRTHRAGVLQASRDETSGGMHWLRTSVVLWGFEL